MKQMNRGVHYNDVEIGDSFLSASRTISEADVYLFAGLTGDFNELHTSDVYVKGTTYGERIAHGMLTLAIANGLYVRMNLFPNSVFLGIENWRFLNAVKLGDTISLKLTIETKRTLKDGKRGIIGMKYEVLNQNSEKVAEGLLNRMVNVREREKDE